MNKQTPKNQVQFNYDLTASMNRVKQFEAVIIALQFAFKEHINKERLIITTETKHDMTTVTIQFSSVLNENYINDICQAINTAAFYAVEDQARSNTFVEFAEAIKS